MTSDRIEPPFICDDEQCSPGVCSLADLPTWIRPYRCQYLGAADRRARDIVIREYDRGR